MVNVFAESGNNTSGKERTAGTGKIILFNDSKSRMESKEIGRRYVMYIDGRFDDVLDQLRKGEKKANFATELLIIAYETRLACEKTDDAVSLAYFRSAFSSVTKLLEDIMGMPDTDSYSSNKSISRKIQTLSILLFSDYLAGLGGEERGLEGNRRLFGKIVEQVEKIEKLADETYDRNTKLALLRVAAELIDIAKDLWVK